MSFDDILDTAAVEIFNACGVEGTFTPLVGDAVEGCMFDLIRNTDNEPSSDSQVWGSNITIKAILSVIGKEPDKGDIFTINSVDYTVQKVVATDGRFVTVAVK